MNPVVIDTNCLLYDQENRPRDLECDLALNNGSTSIRKQDWKDLGENAYFLKCQVQDGASFSISVKDSTNEYWNIVVNYDIEP